jgi:hypothetical protein
MALGNGKLITMPLAHLSNLFTSLGSGITTSLIALIANAGPEDQAISTAGKSIPVFLI